MEDNGEYIQSRRATEGGWKGRREEDLAVRWKVSGELIHYKDERKKRKDLRWI